MSTRHTSTLTRILILPVLATLFLVACQGGTEPTPAPTTPATFATAAVPAATGDISALGTVRPAQTLALSFTAGGPLHSLTAGLGMAVAEGDLLAELDTSALALQIESAEQEVALCGAQLDRLVNGPDPSQVERAEADHAHQLAGAELALRVAQAALAAAEVRNAADLAGAEIAAEKARLLLEQAQAGDASSAVAVARVRLNQATSALAEAQEAYDQAWDPARDWEAYMTDPTSPYPEAPPTGPSLSDRLEADRVGTERALESAQAAVEIAQAEYQGAVALGALLPFQVQLLEGDLALAELQVETLGEGVDPALAAEVERARLERDRLLDWQNPLLDPAPAEEVAQAGARLRQAELALAQLELQLEGARLRAPFDGLVSAVYSRPGEWAGPGAPVVELIDTTRWLVETRNVGELTIGRVRLGAGAAVRVNAFGGQELAGQVVAVSPTAVVQQGDTTYTLTIELAPTELNLRSGMTAQVQIHPGG
jgi:multidrug resistance efflux pump